MLQTTYEAPCSCAIKITFILILPKIMQSYLVPCHACPVGYIFCRCCPRYRTCGLSLMINKIGQNNLEIGRIADHCC